MFDQGSHSKATQIVISTLFFQDNFFFSDKKPKNEVTKNGMNRTIVITLLFYQIES